jgi:hypothetical protein
MSLILQSSGGGQITLQEPATASNFTQTLPAADGVTMVTGNMPAFSAYANATQTISNGTFTKVTYSVEDFDTNNNFASSRFTPTVAGYYQINAHCAYGAGSGSGETLIAIYKNGTRFADGMDADGSNYGYPVSSLIYCNGTSDYLEIYTLQSSGGNKDLSGNRWGTYFNGALVRAA